MGHSKCSLKTKKNERSAFIHFSLSPQPHFSQPFFTSFLSLFIFSKNSLPTFIKALSNKSIHKIKNGGIFFENSTVFPIFSYPHYLSTFLFFLYLFFHLISSFSFSLHFSLFNFPNSIHSSSKSLAVQQLPNPNQTYQTTDQPFHPTAFFQSPVLLFLLHIIF